MKAVMDSGAPGPFADTEMSRRVCAFDWSATPLGRMADWPAELRVAVSLVLGSGFPSALVWGPDFVTVHNDAFIPILGRKADALGRSFADVWAEVWDEIAPMVARAYAGEPVVIENYPMLLDRFGAPAQGHFTFSYSSVRLADGRVGGMIATMVETTEAMRVKAALERSEHRFRTLAESIDGAFYLTDINRRALLYLSPAFEHIWGRPAAPMFEDLSGFMDTIHPEDRDVVRGGYAVQAEDRPVECEYRIIRPDGEIRWILDRSFPVPPDGGIRQAAGVAIDITERKRVDQRLETLIEGMPQLVWRSADDGEWTWSSSQWTRYTGLTVEQSRGRGWLDALHPDDRETAMGFWHEAERRRRYETDFRLRDAATGRYRWFQTRAMPVVDKSGAIVEWLGTSTDIDDLRMLQERQRLLVAELQHRVRNILTVVRSVFGRTAEAGSSLEDVVDHFRGRLDALARTHAVLTRNAAGTVDLEDMIRDELISVGVTDNPGVRVTGPDTALPSNVAETLCLAIHELTTNSLKYGALRVTGATLDINWSTDVDYGGAPKLNFAWSEQGVPAISVQPAREGFGRELIEEALPYRLGAETKLEFRGGGVRCSIALPLATGAGARATDMGVRL